MSSQESNTSSLQSVLFDYDETRDYIPLPLSEIRKQTEKCIRGDIDDYNENESDVSIDIDSSENSDESESDDEPIPKNWKIEPNQEVNPEAFHESIGPCHNLDHDSRPVDYFSMFWNDLLIEQIVNETNRLAIHLSHKYISKLDLTIYFTGLKIKILNLKKNAFQYKTDNYHNAPIHLPLHK